MNTLALDKKVQILNMLVEGSSLRSISRITGASINTVSKLLVDAGRASEAFHHTMVRNVPSKRLQFDEIWSFVYAKEAKLPEDKQGQGGDVWTWTAIDADSKLIVSWLVGDRSRKSAFDFISDVKERISTQRPQVSTDGYWIYKTVVQEVWDGFVDFAQITKIYGAQPTNNPNSKNGRYGTLDCIGTEVDVITGAPDRNHISTSYAERANLTMRMHMRRFTRSTNAFSKKMENHWLAIALHFLFYNFMRVHKTLRVTPAMEAGIAKRPLTFEDLVRIIEQKED